MCPTPDDFKHRPQGQDAGPRGAGSRKATQKVPASPRTPGGVPDPPARAKLPPLPALQPRPKIRRNLTPEPAAAAEKTWRMRWERWGGRSLVLSFFIHVLILGSAALIVVHHVTDRQMDFIPGGGSVQGAEAEQALQYKIQQKKNPWLKQAMPNHKLAVAHSIQDVMVLSEPPDMLDFSTTAKPMGAGATGAMGAGFGLAGTTGGLGSGKGLGPKSGMVFGPLFGLTIKAKKLAVVLDVSSSMRPHLQRVVTEVDKVAKGSVVVLYFGCGLEPPLKPLVGTKIFKTSTVEFEKFWRMGGASFMETATYTIKTQDPIPEKELFLKLSRRPQTYFIHNVGVGYAWLALLSDEVRNADGLYWFSDFQDAVEPGQMSVVLENLQRRKQRLYIHASGKGPSFDTIKEKLVIPTEGDSYIDQ